MVDVKEKGFGEFEELAVERAVAGFVDISHLRDPDEPGQTEHR